MLTVELEGDDFDKSEGFVKIGRLNSAIAKANGANNLQNTERKLLPRINAGVQLGKLNPLDPETLEPLSKSDYGNGIVPIAELVAWGQSTKLFDFRRAQFTVKGIHGESTMSRAAYEEYQRALENRRAMGRYTLEEAAQFVADNSNANAKSIYTKLEKSAETGELTIHWPGSDEVYKPKPRNPMFLYPTGLRGFEEAYWNDLNDWLEIKERRIFDAYSFPKPDASIAKIEAIPVITPSGDDWTEKARAIADECFDHDTKMKCRDSLKNYANRVMGLMQERGITGARGIINNPATIMRDALQSKKWWANKSK